MAFEEDYQLLQLPGVILPASDGTWDKSCAKHRHTGYAGYDVTLRTPELERRHLLRSTT